MKKSKMGIIIAAIVMIVTGIGLCVGGVMAAGGIEAAKNALLGNGIDLNRVYQFEVDEDGFDIDFEIGNHDVVHHEAAHHTERTTASEKQSYVSINAKN